MNFLRRRHVGLACEFIRLVRKLEIHRSSVKNLLQALDENIDSFERKISIMKRLVLFTFLLAIGLQGFSQQDYKKFRMGFKVTPSISWMQPKDNNMTSEGARLGFGFGLVSDIFFAENYAIGTGLNITWNGGKINYLQETQIEEASYIMRQSRNIRTQFIEIPLTIKLRTNEIGYITYWGQFGLGLGFNLQTFTDDVYDYQLFKNELDGSISWDKTDLPSEEFEKENINDEIGFARASLIMAAGIEYNLSGSTSILAGVEFNNGFTNVFNNERGVEQNNNEEALFEGVTPRTFKLRSISNMLQFQVGILF